MVQLKTKNIIIEDRSKVILSCGRNNANATDIYLRAEDGVPLNVSSFIVGFNANILGMTLTSGSDETWVAEIYKNNDIDIPPTQGNRIAYLSVTSASYKREIFSSPVSIDDQDRLAVYCRGTQIDNPKVTVILEKR